MQDTHIPGGFLCYDTLCPWASLVAELVPAEPAGKEFTYNAGDPGLIPGLGKSPGEWIGTHSSILRLPWWLRR